MKTVLFITLNDIKSFDIKSIYTDLAKEFFKKGHQVTFISPEKLGMKWLKIFRKNSIYNENSKKSDIMSLSTILDLI